MKSFAEKMLAWYDLNGRKNLPWKSDSIPAEQRPYRIWLSEVMLQQTQVATVLPYYQRFIDSFPSLESLAMATQDEVLTLWSGLGYYARGRNLHKAAQLMWQDRQSVPDSYEQLLDLPGVGRSTAGAIMAQAFHKPYAILDGNVKRVLARVHAVDGWPGQAAVAKKLWKYAESHTPKLRVAEYTQAIMDFGAKVCVRSKPLCDTCNLAVNCMAYQNKRTADFPASKPKKNKPIKQAHVLCVIENGEVLLQQRPPAGIWGGLWSFPEFNDINRLNDYLNDIYGVELSILNSLAAFRHSFSHFHLDIHPHVLNVSDKMSVSVVKELNARYFSLEKVPDVGISAPVKILLDHLSNLITERN